MLANESTLKSRPDAKISDMGVLRTTANIHMTKCGTVMLKSEMLHQCCLMLTFDLGSQDTNITGMMFLFFAAILKKKHRVLIKLPT